MTNEITDICFNHPEQLKIYILLIEFKINNALMKINLIHDIKFKKPIVELKQ